MFFYCNNTYDSGIWDLVFEYECDTVSQDLKSSCVVVHIFCLSSVAMWGPIGTMRICCGLKLVILQKRHGKSVYGYNLSLLLIITVNGRKFCVGVIFAFFKILPFLQKFTLWENPYMTLFRKWERYLKNYPHMNGLTHGFRKNFPLAKITMFIVLPSLDFFIKLSILVNQNSIHWQNTCSSIDWIRRKYLDISTTTIWAFRNFYCDIDNIEN